MDKLCIARGYPSIVHSWSAIRDWVFQDVCTLPRNTVWKIECSGEDRKETQELLQQKGFLVASQDLVTELDWKKEITSIHDVELHNYLAFALPKYQITQSNCEEIPHWTYKTEFSMHNCLVKRQQLLDRLCVVDKFPPLIVPDDTIVAKEKMLTLFDVKDESKTYSVIRKQINALQKLNVFNLHEIVVNDLKDTQVLNLNNLLEKDGFKVEFASYRQLGYKEGTKKVIRVSNRKQKSFSNIEMVDTTSESNSIKQEATLEDKSHPCPNSSEWTEIFKRDYSHIEFPIPCFNLLSKDIMPFLCKGENTHVRVPPS